MISMPPSVGPATSAAASLCVSSRPRTWRMLVVLCTILAVLLGGVGNIAFAQTAHFSGSTPTSWTQNTLQIPTGNASGIALDGAGSFYFSNILNKDVQKFTLSSNGTITESNIGVGLNTPWAVAVDGSGNVFISDYGNNLIVKETLSGSSYIQSAVASATAGGLNQPQGVALDGSGNIYIADSGNNRILIESPVGSGYTQTAAVSNLPNGVSSIAVDESGNIYFLDRSNNVMKETRISAGNYFLSTIAQTPMPGPSGSIAVDRSGNVFYAASYYSGGAWLGYANEYSPQSGSYAPSNLNIGQAAPTGIAIDGNGNLYFIASNVSGVLVETPVYENSFGAVNIGTTSASIPMVFTFDTSGTLGSTAVLTQGATGLDFSDAGPDTCVANTAYTAGQTCTVNVAFTPRFAGIRNGAVVLKDSSGNPFATGYLQGTGVGPQVVFQPGVQSVLGGSFSQPASVAVDGKGNIYVSDVSSGVLYEMVAINGTVPASPTIKTIGSGFGSVAFITVDGAGNLYVADATNNAVKEIQAVNGSIPASPTIRTLSSRISNPSGIAVDGNGDVFVTAMGDSTVREIIAVNGSIPASPVIITLGSGFHYPIGIAVDASGNVYVGDMGNSAVKEILAVNGTIPASPTILTLGTGFSKPYGLALDGRGDLYVADYGNSTVKEIVAVNGSIPASPTINTLGSGFSQPGDVAVDGGGNVYVADTANNRVVKLDFADPPSLTFSSTVIGSASPDSPRTITVENAGNAALTFPIPSSGNNPSISANFTLKSSGSLDCPLLSSGSSEPGTLAPGESCQLPISFLPTAAGSFSGSLVLTDNNLSAAAPGYATQSLALGGTGIGFTLTASPAALSVTQGGSGSSTITVTSMAGFTGSVNLAVTSVLPSGVTASFSANPTTGTSVLTLTASSAVATGTYNVIVNGTSNSQSATTTLTLTVNPSPFSLSASPSSLSVNQGGSGTSTITVTGQSGFTGNVTLTASGLPSGVTASFGTNPTTGTSVLTLSASSTSSLAFSQAVVISGTSGALTETTTILLTVYPPADFGIQTVPYTSGQILEGSSGSFTVSLDYFNGFNSAIELSASGLPAGDSISFSPGTPPAPGYGAYTATVVVGTNTAPGVYPITITGIGGGITHSVTYTLTVPTPDFTITGSTSPEYVFLGQTYYNALYTQILPSNGFSSPIALSVTGQRAGLTINFAPSSFPAPGNGSSWATLSADPTTAPGTYTITLTGTGGGVTHSATFVVIVRVPPDFSLVASPAVLTVYQGASTTCTITSAVTGAFNDAVYLNTSGAPVYGISPSFAPESLPAPGSGSSTMTIGVASFVQPGTYTIFIDGVGGGVNHLQAASIQLNVLQAPSFGSVNVGSKASAIPFTFGFNSPVTLGAASVVTQGATGQDFMDAGTGSCAANTSYGQGQTCTVDVSFSPKFPGTHYGAVVLYDSNGNAIATAYVQGTGIGPQLIYSPALISAPVAGIGSGSVPVGVAVDGSGNIYVANLSNAVTRIPLGCTSASCVTTLGGGFRVPSGIAMDGSGNVYVADQGNNAVTKIPLGCASASCVTALGGGFSQPVGVAVDGSGNVYVADFDNNAVKEMPSSCASASCVTTLGGGFSYPRGVAVDGSGNVYVGDNYNNAVKEIPSGCASASCVTTLGGGFNGPEGVAVDGSGNVYVVDTQNGAVKEMPPGCASTNCVTTLGDGFDSPAGVAVDGSGNVYIVDYSNSGLYEIDRATAPSLTFPSTYVNATSAAQTVTITNDGNALLNFTTITYAANFPESTAATSDCMTTTSLASNEACTLTIDFTPQAAGALSGSLVLTDNNLNAAAPGYATQSIALSGTATQATPAITWATPAAITYGTPLSATQLNATSNVAGSFSYSPAAGTVLTAGQQSLTATFTPTDTANYTAASASVTLTVNQATPTIAWATPAAITYGTPLSAAQLNASSAVAGSFTYSPAAGTVLTAGQQTLTVTFAPTDSTEYTTATATVTLTVNQATPMISWATPAAITYGTPLSAAQLSATSAVAGTFTYSPTAGTVLTAGQQRLMATFTPTDTTDYTTASASVMLTVNKATSVITWATPAAITYGTALSATQLNAKSAVAGTFTYSPATGTVLNAGTQTLTVTFTPTDTTDYTTATASVKLTVNKAVLAISWATPATISFGTALSGTQLDATSNATGTFVYSPAAGTVPPVGSNTLNVTFTPANPANYTASNATAHVTLTVNKATPAITWATPAPITYGTALSATQLNASSAVAGTFVYSPAVGKVLTAGQQKLTVTFTPTNSTNYTTATASVTLTVSRTTPTITWATPAAITYGTALNATQLNAKASVPGALVYSPAAGTVPAVGTDTLTVTFTPTDTTDYTTATSSVLLKVNPAPSFTLGASPASLSVAQGASGKSTITVNKLNGFTGSVTLAASGLPGGVTAAFATNPTTGSSVLTLTANRSATVGSATITVNGTSGSLTASTTIALTVNCTPTTITPYISINGGSTWTQVSSATVNSPSTIVDLGPQPVSGGSWSWTGPNNYTSASRQINSIPLTVGTDLYVATYTNASGCKSTQTFTITIK